jgi:antitoxin (DNA-binding transcriptional repressor) of toxin-antitoxin stability system
MPLVDTGGWGMIKVDLKEAQGNLEHLVDEAAGGEEVIITRGDGARFRIVPLQAAARPSIVGNSLDHLIGTWSEEEEAEFLKAIEVFEEIDESLWS